MNILKETPDFEFSFKKGILRVSSDLVMDDGNYNGYLKPVLDDIKIIDLTPDSEKEKVFF